MSKAPKKAKKADKSAAIDPALYDLIRAPLITEKGTMVSEHNQVVFRVPLSASKPEIKTAIEKLFKKSRGLPQDNKHYFREMVVFSENLGQTMVRDERYKYAHYADGDSELYDLATDPTEEHNLASDAAQQGEVVRLRALLLEHTLRTHQQRAKKVERQREPADDEHAERLERPQHHPQPFALERPEHRY